MDNGEVEEVKIRKLDIDEIERLGELAEKFYASSEFLQGFSLEVFRESWTSFLSSGLGVIFVLEADGKLMGAIGGLKYPDPNSGEWTATEFFWFVDEACRGKGLLLLKRFEEWARGQGCKKILMVHLLDLMPEKVKRVYERYGYKAIEVHYAKEVG